MPGKFKNIVYTYLFNYFGKGKYNDKVITGACIDLAIKVYKNGKQVQLDKEIECNDAYLCDVFKVSFDRDKGFVVTKNLKADNLFRLVYEFDKIEYEVVGYALDYLSSLPEEAEKDLPEEFKDFPCFTSMEVTEEVFKQFLAEHKDDFDISDNKNAQVPAIAFI